MKKFMFPVAILAAALFLYACDCKEDEKELADLVVTSAEFADDSQTFEVGDIVDVAVRIFNLLGGDCTKDAGQSEHQLALYRRGQNGGADEVVGTAYYQVPRIKADNGFDDQPDVQFDAPGEYYVREVADAQNNVEERDENNNNQTSTGTACAGCKLSNPIRTITVQSTPEFEARVRRGEHIPYVSFPSRPNLRRVELKYFQ